MSTVHAAAEGRVLIPATTLEVREAYRAFQRICEETRLTEDAAWPVSRLMVKLKRVAAEADEQELMLYQNAGAVQEGQRLVLAPPVRHEGEADAAFDGRLAEHAAQWRTLQASVRALNKEPVEIDVTPVPRSYFRDPEGTKPERRRLYSANDFLNAGPFLVEG